MIRTLKDAGLQFLKLVLILIQTSQLLPGLVLICMLQQVRLPLAGLFHRLHLHRFHLLSTSSCLDAIVLLERPCRRQQHSTASGSAGPPVGRLFSPGPPSGIYTYIHVYTANTYTPYSAHDPPYMPTLLYGTPWPHQLYATRTAMSNNFQPKYTRVWSV